MRNRLNWWMATLVGLTCSFGLAACSSNDDEVQQGPSNGSAGHAGGAGGQAGGAGGQAGGAGGQAGGAGGQVGGAGGQAGGAGGQAGGAGGQAGGAGGPSNCKVITVKDLQVEPVLDSYYLEGVTEPNIGSASKPDPVVISFHETDSEKLTPGTFDLSQGPDKDFATCLHCVYAEQDWNKDGTVDKKFFQVSGSVELDTIHSPFDGLVKGKLVNVLLREVTIDDVSMESKVVPGGECLIIKKFEFDTDRTGDSCSRIGECAPGACDPVDKKCKAAQCSKDKACADKSQSCFEGICLPGCVPFDDQHKCGAAQQCFPFDLGQTGGVCRPAGSKAINAKCEPDLVDSTDCVAGAVCGDISPDLNSSDWRCVEQCNFFGASASCSVSGQYCSYGGWCWSGTPSNAKLGQECAAGEEEKDCGVENGIARGICFKDKGDPKPVCRKWCRTASGYDDCGSNGKCNDVSERGLGLCLP